MQMILSCEKIMKRKLVPWEQEALLYARMCGDVACREWKQSKLKDCEGCGQVNKYIIEMGGNVDCGNMDLLFSFFTLIKQSVAFSETYSLNSSKKKTNKKTVIFRLVPLPT